MMELAFATKAELEEIDRQHADLLRARISELEADNAELSAELTALSAEVTDLSRRAARICDALEKVTGERYGR